MATYVIYAGTEDGLIVSDSGASYANARAGSGTVTAYTSNAIHLAPGQVYDGYTYAVFQGFVQFDTSILTGLTISSATLAIYGALNYSGVDFTINARLHDWGTALTSADYVAAASLSSKTLLATFATSGFSTSGYNTFTDSAMVANVNTSGSTRMLLSSSRTEANNTPSYSASAGDANDERVYFQAADTTGTTQDPKLTVVTSTVTTTVTSDAVLSTPSPTKTATSDALLASQVTKTATSDSALELGARTLSKVLRGEAVDNNLRVYGAMDGQAYRLYDSAGSTVASAVVSGGIAEMTNPGTVSGGRLVGYSSNSYATPLSGQWWHGDFQEGNVFDARPSFTPLDTEAAFYYPTSQYGGRAQVCESSTKRFILYRTGGVGTSLGGTNGNVVVVRQDKESGFVDQGPVTIRSGIDEGHEVFCIARNPVDGKLRFVYGGQNAGVYMRESSSADDVTAWGSAVQILGAQFAYAGTFAIDSNGRNHFAAGTYSGGDLVYGTSSNADPTNVTWTTLVNATGFAGSGWGVLFGDMTIFESGGTVTVGIAWGMYKKDGTFPTAYRYAYYAQTSDNGATFKKASGSTITLPMLTNGTTGAVSAADEISTAYHYGAWTHLAFLAGAVPHVLVDNGTDAAETYLSVRYWNGSSWVKNTTNIPMWESSHVNADWGVLLTSDDSTRLYLYASIGYSFDPTLDATHTGFRLVRQTSTDHFATWSEYTIVDGDTYEPFSYTELADSGTDFNSDQTGICYPKVSTDPRTIVASAVDQEYATVFLASITIADVTSDALLRLSPTKTITSDAVLLATRTATTTSDANLGSQRTTTVTSDASLTSTTTTQTATITSSALLSARRTATVTSNAAIYTSSSSPAKARIVRDTYVTSDQFGSKTVESDTFGERTTYIHPESTIS